MARGVFISIRHQLKCGAKGRDARNCRCSPSIRVRIAGVWLPSERLPKDWRVADLEAVERNAVDAKGDHDAGRRVIEPRRSVPTMRAWAEQWLDEFEADVRAGEASPRTLVSYRSYWSHHLDDQLGDLLVTEVSSKRILELRLEMASRPARGPGSEPYSPRYVNNVFVMLGGMLSTAVPKYLEAAPAIAPRRRRRSARVLPVTTPKLMDLGIARDLLAATDGVVHEMILCGLTTGMREREIAGLKMPSVHFADSRITVENQRFRAVIDGEAQQVDKLPKYERTRDVVLYSGLATRLGSRDGESGYAFIDPDTGEPFASWKMRERLHKAWEAVGPRPRNHSWHVLRHTFSSLLDRNRVRPLLIDALMGHSNPGVASRYKHVWDEEFEAIEAILATTFGPVRVPESAEVVAAGD